MFDLIVKQGRTVTGEIIDVGIKEGKITEVADRIVGEGKEIIDLQGKSYVSAGWIDSHVHCFENLNLYYDFPDKVGIYKGVTTVIDAGSAGAENIGEFYEVAMEAKTNVLSLINISKTGIVEQNELADIENVIAEDVQIAVRKYPTFIIGIKARMSKTVIGENGMVPLHLAKKIQKSLNGLPLMVHIGSAPPKLSDILSALEAGDIVTHCFNGKENGILASDNTIKDFVFQAYEKGIVFDVGHGTDSFNFNVAEIAYQEKLTATTISTDIYHRNREDGPVYDLATTLEKMLEVGYTLPQLIEKVTIKPAEYFKLPNKGQLKVGFDGDMTIFDLVREDKVVCDSNGNKRTVNKQIIPKNAIVGGVCYDTK